jgi:hypothetical protein
MKFECSDAWLLEAIKLSENGDKGATLTDIIFSADYINHAIITNSEFVTGTRKLKSLGLIVEKDKRFGTTDRFNEWWVMKYGHKGRFSALKAIDEIQKYLQKTFGTVEEPTIEIKTEITDGDLEKAINEYHKLASAAIEKLTKKKKKISEARTPNTGI